MEIQSSNELLDAEVIQTIFEESIEEIESFEGGDPM